jgi:hypothetical protein
VSVLLRDSIAVCLGKRNPVRHGELVAISLAFCVRFFLRLRNNLFVHFYLAHPLRHIFSVSVLLWDSVALFVGDCHAVRHRNLFPARHALVLRLFHLLWNKLPFNVCLAHPLWHCICMPVLVRHSVALRVGKRNALPHWNLVAV